MSLNAFVVVPFLAIAVALVLSFFEFECGCAMWRCVLEALVSSSIVAIYFDSLFGPPKTALETTNCRFHCLSHLSGSSKEFFPTYFFSSQSYLQCYANPTIQLRKYGLRNIDLLHFEVALKFTNTELPVNKKYFDRVQHLIFKKKKKTIWMKKSASNDSSE